MIFRCGTKKKGSKKVVALLAILLTLVAVSPAFALMQENRNIELEAYVIANTAATDLWTAVSVSTIIPKYHRIVGVEVAPIDSLAKENFVSLCDQTTIAGATTALTFAEAEAATGQSLSKAFPYPKRLTNGLVVHQGSRTYVTIYYEDLRKF